MTADFEYYGYDNCSSCKNAEAMLKDAGVRFAKREIFKNRLNAEEISALFARIDLTPREMIATRSRPYRDLGLAERKLSDDEIVTLMAEYPALIRRPLVIFGGEALVGFNSRQLGGLIDRTGLGEG